MVIMEAPPEADDETAASERAPIAPDLTQSLPETKKQLLEDLERRYLGAMLELTGGNVAETARRAGVDRRTVFRSISKHAMRHRSGT
ncbi:MAG: helix-turn-helix domain-containing protein [Polyangiaceae bacterium]